MDNTTMTGFGVVRSRGLFATAPDVLHVVGGTFCRAGEDETDSTDKTTKREPGVWYLQAPYPQSLWAVDDADLIRSTHLEAEQARVAYAVRLLGEVADEIEVLVSRSRRLTANLATGPSEEWASPSVGP